MHVTAIQMEIVDGNPAANRSCIETFLKALPEGGLCMLPELWSTGYVQERWRHYAKTDTPGSLDWMREQAVLHRTALCGSLVFLDDFDRLSNRFVLFDAKGTCLTTYDKVHLFKPMDEPRYFEPGRALPEIIALSGVRIAALLCYDLRFPEMFRALALKGVDLFVLPCQWPSARQHALYILSRARAIENQSYMAVCNRTGSDRNGNNFCGGSAIIGPMGEGPELSKKVGRVHDQIDLEGLLAYRSAFAVLSDRRVGVDDL